eukprot:SAG31_NODE_18392_length_638_cov_0.838590_1_plen_102_part_00
MQADHTSNNATIIVSTSLDGGLPHQSFAIDNVHVIGMRRYLDLTKEHRQLHLSGDSFSSGNQIFVGGQLCHMLFENQSLISCALPALTAGYHKVVMTTSTG